jgi:DNA-binding transcriptional ArsR family regulator
VTTKTRGKKKQELDERIFKALAHPLRMSLLTLLNDKTASPSDLAQELGEPLANVSYHIHVLLDLDCIELVETKPVRGALEHYYRALQRPFFRDQDWVKLPASTRRSIFDSLLRQIATDVDGAAKGGGFDRADAHVSRTPLVLDEKGWEEVSEILTDTLDRLVEAQADAAERIAGEGTADAGIASTVAVLHFEGGERKQRAAKQRRRRS